MLATFGWSVVLAFSSLMGAEHPIPMTHPEPTLGEPVEKAHKLDQAIRWIEACQRHDALVFDYEARLIYQERMGREIGPTEDIQTKYRKAPLGVYLRWNAPNGGEERLLYQDERQNIVEKTHFPIAQFREGSATLIRAENAQVNKGRCRPREIGLGKMIHDVAAQWNFERRFDLTEVAVSNVKVNGRRCVLIATSHPQPDDGRFDHHTMRLFIDREHVLPIRIEKYGYPDKPGREPGDLLKSETYLNLSINPGLTDLDFHESNPSYNFATP